MDGFNVKFETIKKKYLSGSAGEDFKNFVMLADLLPKMDPNLDLYRDSTPFGRGDTVELAEGEQLNISATAVNNSKDIELDPKLKAQFYWNAVGLETQKGKTFKFKAGKESSFYTVNVDLRVPFNNREYTIARADFKISTKPKEDSTKTNKISIKAPKEVLVTDLFDAEAIIPSALNNKMKGSYWSPSNCGTTQNATSGKLQFTNPRLEKPYKTTISFNAQDENKNTFASAQVEVLVKPAFFSGSASDVWKGGGNSSGFGIERQLAIRKRMENGGEINSATVSGTANIGWDLTSDFKTSADIEKKLKQDQADRKDFVITSVDIAGFKGFALEQQQPLYGFRGSGYVDAGRPDATMGGYGYAIKGCLVIKFSYSSNGSGFMLGEGTGRGDPAGAWWNDTAFIMSQTRAAATEAKSVLLGLTLAADSTLATTPYKGPKLDGSDLPSVKLAISPDNKKLKKGDVVNVRAVIENEENAEKPLQFTWTGEHTGSGQNVKFTANKEGKQTLTVAVSGVGAASVEFEVIVSTQKPTTNPNSTGETTSKISLSTAKLTEAKTLIKKGMLDEAIVSVDESVKLNPKNTEATKLSKKWKKERTTINTQLSKVKTLTEQGKFDEAEKQLLVAQNLHILYKPVFDADSELKAKRSKNDSAVTEGLGQVRLANEARNFKKALELISEIRRNYKLNSFAVSELKRYEDWAQTHETEKDRQRAIMLAGEAKFNAYDYEGAIKDFDVMWVNHYVYWGMSDPEPKKYGDLRNEAVRRRDYINKLMSEISTVANDKSFDKKIIENALANIDQVLQLQPTNTQAQEYKTFLTDRLGRGEKGAKHDEALNKGTEFYNAQKYNDAIKEYDKAIKADSKSSEAYRGRAMAKRENGDLKGSLKDYDKSIELNPNNSYAFLGRGAVRDKLGDTNGALSDFTRGIELDPTNPRGYESRGGHKTNQQDYQGALGDFDKVVTLEPTNSYAYNNRGYVKEQLGDIKGALKDYEKAVALDSSNELAKNNSAKLKEKLADAAKVVNQPVQPETPKSTNTDLSSWSGEWNTNDNGNKLYLTQTGNRVSGTYPFDEGRIEGRIVGNKLIGTWSEFPTYQPNRDAGDIEFTMSADGKSFTGRWRYGSNEEWRTNVWNGTRANTTPVNKPTQAKTIPTDKEVEIFTSMNIYGVNSKPTAQTTFTITKPHVITYIFTYHWNSASGTRQPGYIGIHNSKGETFKPWKATGTPGQGGVPNAGWETFPNIVLPAGTYTIVDSDPATWSQNAQSGGRGMAIVKGYPTSGKP